MATIAHVRFQSAEINEAAGTAVAGGVTVTLTGGKYVYKNPIADTVLATLWDSSADKPDTWDFLYFECDQSVLLGLERGSDGAGIRIFANKPMVLFSQNGVMGYDTTTGLKVSAASEGVYTKIVLYNDSGQEANPKLILGD